MQRPLVVSPGLFSVFLVDEIHVDVSSSHDSLDEERVECQRPRVTLQRFVQLLQSVVTKGQAVEESVVSRVFRHGFAEIVKSVAVVGRFQVPAWGTEYRESRN